MFILKRLLRKTRGDHVLQHRGCLSHPQPSPFILALVDPSLIQPYIYKLFSTVAWLCPEAGSPQNSPKRQCPRRAFLQDGVEKNIDLLRPPPRPSPGRSRHQGVKFTKGPDRPAPQALWGPSPGDDQPQPCSFLAGSRAPRPEAAVDPHTWQGLSAHSKTELSVTHPLRFP